MTGVGRHGVVGDIGVKIRPRAARPVAGMWREQTRCRGVRNGGMMVQIVEFLIGMVVVVMVVVLIRRHEQVLLILVR